MYLSATTTPMKSPQKPADGWARAVVLWKSADKNRTCSLANSLCTESSDWPGASKWQRMVSFLSSNFITSKHLLDSDHNMGSGWWPSIPKYLWANFNAAWSWFTRNPSSSSLERWCIIHCPCGECFGIGVRVFYFLADEKLDDCRVV